MNKHNFRKTPIALAITGLLLTSTSAQAEDPNLWGRWGGGTVDVSGGTLLVKDPLTGILGDQSILNPGLSNLSLDDSAVVANPGDWILYSMLAYSESGFVAEGSFVASTGNLTLRPPAEGDEGDGEVSVSFNGFIGTGVGFNIFAEGGDTTFPDASGGIASTDKISFSSTSAEGGASFPNEPDFVPFFGEGGLTGAVFGVPLSGEGFGGIMAEGGEGGEDFLAGASTECIPFCFPAFFITEPDGPFLADGFSAEGSYIAGQPTVDISALQAGNVTADYYGASSLFGFNVHVGIDFAPGDFTAEFDDSESFGTFGNDVFGSFEVSGSVTGNTFASDTFVGADGGEVAVVVDAGVNGTLFGPNAEALGGIVGFETEGDIEGTFFDIFAAAQEGVDLPDIAAPEIIDVFD